MHLKKSPVLDRVLQRPALLHLFLPLAALSVLAIGALDYLGERTPENRQPPMAPFIARFVNGFLDQAACALDATAGAVEVIPAADFAFMHGIFDAYEYFDTLYCLDNRSHIMLLGPPDPRCLGLGMSSPPCFEQAEEKKNLIISSPFVILRTGNPTVYLIKQRVQGDRLMATSYLGPLQDEIMGAKDAPDQSTVFCLDQDALHYPRTSPRRI